MPKYRHRIIEPLTDEQFSKLMDNGKFVKQEHRGLIVFVYHSALRIGEALKVEPRQFRLSRNKKKLYVDVEHRFKGSKTTVPLPLPVKAPHMINVLEAVARAKKMSLPRVWNYCRKTGYNIITRVYPDGYPHFFRLNRITQFFSDGFTIDQVRSWTGLTLAALEHYVGVVDVEKMGASLASKRT